MPTWQSVDYYMSKNTSVIATVKPSSISPTPDDQLGPITDEQLEELERLEAEISANLLSGAKLAIAFAKIRVNKLYRENCKTFEEYCKLRWGYSVRYCYRLAEMGEVMTDLKTFEGMDVYPTNEAQARVYEIGRAHV